MNYLKQNSNWKKIFTLHVFIQAHKTHFLNFWNSDTDFDLVFRWFYTLLKELIIEGKHCYFVTLHVYWDCVEQGQGITWMKESVLLLNRHNLTCSCETGYRILPKKQETFPNHSFRIKGACHRKGCVFTLGQSIFCIPVLSMTTTWLLMFSEWFVATE